MLPISVGLPLILSGKKRPKRRRLESARPRGGSAPAGFAGRAVVDPAIPAHSWGLAAGTSRFSRASLRAAACPARRVGRAVDERQTASRPSLVSLVLSKPRGRGFLTRKVVRRRGLDSAGAKRSVQGRAFGRATWPLPAPSPRGPCFQSAHCLIPIKPKPQERKNFGLGTRLNCARPRVACVRVSCALIPEQALHPRHCSSGSGRAPRPRAGSSGAEGPGPENSSSRCAGGRRGRSSAGGFKNTEPLIGL